jgi:hypothetical protein
MVSEESLAIEGPKDESKSAGKEDRSLASLLDLQPQERAYAWVIGRLVDNEVSCIIYGQFTEEKIPPTKGWMYVGRNIRSTVTYDDTDYRGMSVNISSILHNVYTFVHKDVMLDRRNHTLFLFI